MCLSMSREVTCLLSKEIQMCEHIPKHISDRCDMSIKIQMSSCMSIEIQMCLPRSIEIQITLCGISLIVNLML